MSIFSVTSEVQDVEVLLGQVAESLRQWERGDAVPLDLSAVLGEAGKVGQNANRLKGQWNVNSWAIIHSTRPGLGPSIIRFQHAVRKVTWWYLEPIIQQIRAFQMNAALTISSLAQTTETMAARQQQQAAELLALQQRLEALEAKE